MKKRAEEFVNGKGLELNGLPSDKQTVINWLSEFAEGEFLRNNGVYIVLTTADLIKKN